jgi:group I intron endonuclease
MCIYLIINLQNNKIYIGSAVNFNKRKNYHLSYLRRNKHINYKLQNDFNIYGEEWFVFKIFKKANNDYKKLLKLEQSFLDSLKPDYNIAKYVEQPYYGRKHSKETIEKIRKANTGIKFSKERCERISKANKNKKRKPLSEKTKNKLKELRVSKPVNQYDLNNIFIKSYPSIKEAERQTKINRGNISDCCNNNITKTGGFIWKFKS